MIYYIDYVAHSACLVTNVVVIVHSAFLGFRRAHEAPRSSERVPLVQRSALIALFGEGVGVVVVEFGPRHAGLPGLGDFDVASVADAVRGQEALGVETNP